MAKLIYKRPIKGAVKTGKNYNFYNGGKQHEY